MLGLSRLYPQKKREFAETLDKALSLVENGSDKGGIESLLSSLEEANKLFASLKNTFKNFVLHLSGHAHIDMNWFWTWENTLQTCKNTFESVDRLMKEYPGFYFSQSQAAVYLAVEEHFPELFKRIKKRVEEKRWDITASTWVEGDLNMASGEALVRQILYAKRYIKEKFGVESKICWSPDTFGHPWTFPQILKKSGIDYYFFCRCGKDMPLFWWEGPDGSRVLAANNSSYNGEINTKAALLPIEVREKCNVNDSLFVYGVGNHGGGPTRRDIEKAILINKMPALPTMKFDSTLNFFKAILSQNRNYPVVRDELNFIYEGCYTTHADIKLMNRRSENLLPSAEAFSAIGMQYGLNYPGKAFEKAWRNICFNQFHDLLDGTAIHLSYEHSRQLFDEVMKITYDAMDNALNLIASKVKFNNLGTPVVAFNSLAWERVDLVELNLKEFSIQPQSVLIKDSSGNTILSQISGDKVIFLAKVPSLGYETYYLGDGRQKDNNLSILTAESSGKLENQFFTIQIDLGSGCISRLFDKVVKREVLSPYSQGNLFQVLFERPHSMSGWNIGPISKVENLITGANIEVIESGPVRATIRIRRRFNKSSISQDISIYKDIPMIDFKTEVDWQETGNPDVDAPMLKVAFPLAITSDKATFEIPFGYISRPTDGHEAPALKWVDLSSDGYGVSLLNDCKYGHDVQGNTIRLTLLRSSYEPDRLPDVGKHKFTYSLYPHRHNWEKAYTVRRGYELNNPLISKIINRSVSPNIDKHLPLTNSFIEVLPSNIFVSVLKKSEDDKNLIIRMYEGQGKKVVAKVKTNLPVAYAIETDMMERPIKGKRFKISNGIISFPLGKHEIKTLKLMIK